MEQIQQENNKLYIEMSKTSIDYYIRENDFKNAFSLFIIVLEMLDENEKKELISYYSKDLMD